MLKKHIFSAWVLRLKSPFKILKAFGVGQKANTLLRANYEIVVRFNYQMKRVMLSPTLYTQEEKCWGGIIYTALQKRGHGRAMRTPTCCPEVFQLLKILLEVGRRLVLIRV